MQLDLLTYTLTPEEQAKPDPIANPPPNPHLLAYHEARAAYYLRAIATFMSGGQTSQQVRRHEIQRLHGLRQQALQALKDLTGEP